MQNQVAPPFDIPPDLPRMAQARMTGIQMLPDIAQQALLIARSPDTLISDFITVVEKDVKLAADTVALANSVLYSPTSPILSLKQAVIHLGFRHCQNLIISSSMSALMERISLEEEWIRAALHRHGLLTGMLCVRLNAKLGSRFDGEEFTAGLIHDFGRLIFATILADRFSEIDPMDFDEGPDCLEAERTVIGANHCSMGAWFAHSNNLPEPLVQAMLFHHTPEQAGKYKDIVALVAVADHMANHLQRGLDPWAYDLSLNPGIPVLESEFRRSAVRKLGVSAVELLERTSEDIGSML